MFKLPQSQTKTLVAVHGWSAIALGFLLYAVVITGTITVFANEIGHWSIGRGEAVSVFDQPVDAHIRKAIASVDAKYRDDLNVVASPLGNLRAWIHTREKRDTGNIEDRGVVIEIDQSTGQEIVRREGWAGEVLAEPATALERFLVDVHVRLHLPHPWGLILTGILGLAMMAAAVSGLLMHRHLVKDSFTLRRHKETLVAARDEHSVAGTWGLPFAFLLALTGAFFSFALSIGLPVMSFVAFGGNQEKLIAAVAGTPPVEDKRPARMADLDAIIREARVRASGEVRRLEISHYGRMDARATVRLAPAKGALQPATLVFSAADGSFEKAKPSLGTSPSLGSTLFSIIAPLHFGNFGGVVSKLVWLALGFASCFLIATGMTLWLKRRAEDTRWRVFGYVNATVIYGLPIGLVASAYGFLLIYPAHAAITAPPVAFLIGAAATIGYAVFTVRRSPAPQLDANLMRSLGVLLMGLPVVRILAGGMFWPSAITNGAYETVAVDFVLLLVAVICLRLARKWRSGPGYRSPMAHRVPGSEHVRPAK